MRIAMMCICFYLVSGVAWWFGNANLKEHADVWKTMNPIVKPAYVIIQLVAVVLWPLGAVGWAVTKGIFGRRAKTNFENQTEEWVRDLSSSDPGRIDPPPRSDTSLQIPASAFGPPLQITESTFAVYSSVFRHAAKEKNRGRF